MLVTSNVVDPKNTRPQIVLEVRLNPGVAPDEGIYDEPPNGFLLGWR